MGMTEPDRYDHADVDAIKITSPGDVICAVSTLLGFEPHDSVAFLTVQGERGRVGMVMRYDLDAAVDLAGFAAEVAARLELEAADGVFVVVYDDEVSRGVSHSGAAGGPTAGNAEPRPLPHELLVQTLTRRLGPLVIEAMLAGSRRWWSYLCDEACCGGPEGTPIDRESAAGISLTAAYALRGHGVLANREAVIRSVALDLDPDEALAVRDRISGIKRRHRRVSQAARRRIMRRAVERLTAADPDPRDRLADVEAAELAALLLDVVVRDEMVVRAAGPEVRERLLPVLGQLARRTPPPYDAPVCAVLAWVAYADGDGVTANVALERALRSDPDYPFARLTADSLHRQVPPVLLELVMLEAGLDLMRRDAAGSS
jgi:Domain of unknown function (DUF4192)